MHRILTSSVFATTIMLAGCGPQVSAPSLLPRAVEKQPIDMPLTDAREAETPATPALLAQVAAVTGAADAADRAFAAQKDRSAAAVARAVDAVQGSEVWIAAQESLTALDAARGPVAEAATALDALRQDPANAGPGNRAAIDQAAKRVEQMDAAQKAAIAALARRLR